MYMSYVSILYKYVYVYQSIYLSIYLPIYLSIYLSQCYIDNSKGGYPTYLFFLGGSALQ